MLLLAYFIIGVVFFVAAGFGCYCAGVLVSRVVHWNDKRYERALAYRSRVRP